MATTLRQLQQKWASFTSSNKRLLLKTKIKFLIRIGNRLKKRPQITAGSCIGEENPNCDHKGVNEKPLQPFGGTNGIKWQLTQMAFHESHPHWDKHTTHNYIFHRLYWRGIICIILLLFVQRRFGAGVTLKWPCSVFWLPPVTCACAKLLFNCYLIECLIFQSEPFLLIHLLVLS